MKKSLLFMLNNMNIGGTEKAFLNLLEEIDKDEYEITLLLLDKSGGFMSKIPSYANIISVENYTEIEPLIKLPPIKSMKLLLHKHMPFKAISLIINHIISKLLNDRTHYWNFIYNNLKLEIPDVDIAIAYAGPYDLISTCILNCKAKIKVQWIHFDVSKIGFDIGFADRNYKKFDKIYVVSDKARNELISRVPKISSITETMHNVISKELCIQQSLLDKGFDDDFNGTRILTVGRLSKEKRQDIIPEIVEELVSKGFNFRWYLIGDGSLRKDIEKSIKEKKIEGNLILLGTKINPYPFYKECDLYVQTSLYEGYCITIMEALAFDKYVISTDVSGVYEQIKSKSQGVICDNSKESILCEVENYLIENS